MGLIKWVHTALGFIELNSLKTLQGLFNIPMQVTHYELKGYVQWAYNPD